MRSETSQISAAPRDAEPFDSAVLDAVNAQVAVLDANGTIVAVNRPWRTFALENSATPGHPAPRTDVGTNYLEICRGAQGPGADGARAVHDGIRAVLDGSAERFSVEYPCHAPDRRRWFQLTVAPLDGRRRGAVVSHTDISVAMQLSDELSAARQRLQALMDALPVGVSFSEDPDCRHVTGNPSLLAQFEMTPDDNVSASAPEPVAAGRRVRYLQGGRELQDHELPLQRAAAEGTAVAPTEIEIHLPSGRQWFAEVSAAPIRDTHGHVTGSAAVVVDITERKRMEGVLREADRRKDEFLAMLAHELRNPLTPIRNAIHIMELLDLHHPRLRWVREVIDLQLRHLTRLVDDLMDVSRFMRGKITLNKEVLDVAAVMDNAAAAVSPAIEGRGQRLTVRLPPERVWLSADRIRLTQILVNLLDNASKFTTDGGHIALEADAAGGEVAIRVRDDGRGIAPGLLPHVFELFLQGDTSLDRPMGGLGIGLTLAQQLARMQGGRIEAASPGVGRGATFTLHLPVAELVPAAVAPHVREALRPATPTRVLVVDDDTAVADSTGMWLEMMGYDPRIARSGPDALELAASFHPRAVLLDIGLAGLDGYETAQRLRGLPDGDAMLLVAITGYGDDEAVARSRAAGFDYHLVKPFDPKALLRLLSRPIAGNHDVS